jgi:hypothetical protein
MGGNVRHSGETTRNEMLCGTGFFTNIWQYKCTDLGDIEDEGKIKAMKKEAKMDSLMEVEYDWRRESCNRRG